MPCELGHYCKEGAAAALPCEGGTFSNETDLQSSDQCTVCPPGTFCFAGSTAATNCSAGTCE